MLRRTRPNSRYSRGVRPTKFSPLGEPEIYQETSNYQSFDLIFRDAGALRPTRSLNGW